MGCAQCERVPEGESGYQVVCRECDYNYFLLNGTLCTPDCSLKGSRNYKANLKTQRCEDCGDDCPSQPESCGRGEYLKITDVPHQKGSCSPKTAGMKRVEVFVSNLLPPGTDPNGRDGGASQPVGDLGNGIVMGIEKAARHSEGLVMIYLYKGTHFLLWDYVEYLPLGRDVSANYSMVIK